MTRSFHNVVDLYAETYEQFVEYLCNEGLFTQEPWSTFIEKFKDCLDLFNDPSISGLGTKSLALVNPIDKYSLTSEVKGLYSQGKDPNEIANYISETLDITISSKQVSDWLTTFSNAPITKPNQGRWGNVFDIGSQMQNMFDDLNEMISDVKIRENNDFKGKSDKSEILLSHSSELRQLLKDATSILEVSKRMEEQLRFKEIILEEIKKENPSCAERIILRIRDARTAYTTFD